jgi:hypothetical protein
MAAVLLKTQLHLLAKLHLSHHTQAAIHALKQGLFSLNDIELRPLLG